MEEVGYECSAPENRVLHGRFGAQVSVTDDHQKERGENYHLRGSQRQSRLGRGRRCSMSDTGAARAVAAGRGDIISDLGDISRSVCALEQSVG